MKKGKNAQNAVPITPLPKKEKSKKKEDTTKEPDDPEFAEFKEIHSRRQKDIWDNDGIDGSAIKPTLEKDENEDSLVDKIAHKKDLSDLEVVL